MRVRSTASRHLLFWLIVAVASVPGSVLTITTAEDANDSLLVATPAASYQTASEQSTLHPTTATKTTVPSDVSYPALNAVSFDNDLRTNITRALTAVAASSPDDAPAAQCTILLKGSNGTAGSSNSSSNSSRKGLRKAALHCTGRTVTAAVNKLLAKFWGSFTGWQQSSDASCVANTAECLFTFCSGTKVTFGPGSEIWDLRSQDMAGVQSVFCLRDGVVVEFKGANISFNSGDKRRNVVADRKTNSIFSVNDTSELLLTDCHAEGNQYIRIVDGDGSGSNTVISSSNFTANAGTANGAVIRLKEAGSLSVLNSTFVTNQVVQHNAGGGEKQQQQQQQQRRRWTVVKQYLTVPDADVYGAIWATGTGSVTFRNTLFQDNLVSGFEPRGGAIVVEGNRSAPIVFDSVIFNYNRVRGDAPAGGALYLGGTATGANISELHVSITNSTFNGNLATGPRTKGGAIMVYGIDDANITNSNFTNNTCYGPLGEGAGISFGGMSYYRTPEPVITFKKTIFRDNMAELGACISLTGGLQTIRTVDSVFQNNTAAVYGGVLHAVLEYQGHLKLDLMNSSFLNNSAAADGGALFIRQSSTQGGPKTFTRLLDGTIFVNNTAKSGSGGAICLRGGTLTLGAGVQLFNNSAGQNGGGVAMYPKWPGPPEVGPPNLLISSGMKRDTAKNVAEAFQQMNFNRGGGPANKSANASALLLVADDVVSSGNLTVSHNVACKMGGGFYLAEEVDGNWREDEVERVLGATVISNDAVTCYDLSLPGKCAGRGTGFDCEFGCCHVGQVLDNVLNICVACQGGMFSISNNATDSCQVCPTPGGFCPGGSYVFARPGFWTSGSRGSPGPGSSDGLNPETDSLHSKTLVGTTSSASAAPGLMVEDESAVSMHAPVIYKCPNPTACINALNFSTAQRGGLADMCGSNPTMEVEYAAQCAQGYHGPLCGVCDDNYNQRLPFVCAECPSVPLPGLLFAGFAVMLLIYIQWVTAWAANIHNLGRDMSFNTSDITRVTVWFLQGLVIISGSGVRVWGPAYRQFIAVLSTIFSPGMGSIAPLYCVLGSDAANLDLPWVFKRSVMTVLTPVIFTLGAVTLHVILRILLGPLLRWMSRWQLGPKRGILWHCCYGLRAAAAAAARSLAFDRPFMHFLDPITQTSTKHTGIPIPAAAAAAGAAKVPFLVDLLQRLPLLCVVAVQWCYPSLLRDALSFFACISVDGKLLWLADVNVQCWAGRHLAWSITFGLIMVLIFCIGLPLAVGAFYRFVTHPRAQGFAGLRCCGLLCYDVNDDVITHGGESAQVPYERPLMSPGGSRPAPTWHKYARASPKVVGLGQQLPAAVPDAAAASDVQAASKDIDQHRVPTGMSISKDPSLAAASSGSSSASEVNVAPVVRLPCCLSAVKNYLFRSYRSTLGYFEVLIHLRLVALVLISVWDPIIGGLYSAVACGCVITLCMLLQLVFKPFKEFAFDHLQVMCYFVLLLNVVGGILLYVDANNLWKNAATVPTVSILLLSFAIVFILWVLLLVVLTIMANHRHAKSIGSSTPQQQQQQQLLYSRRENGWWVLPIWFGKGQNTSAAAAADNSSSIRSGRSSSGVAGDACCSSSGSSSSGRRRGVVVPISHAGAWHHDVR